VVTEAASAIDIHPLRADELARVCERLPHRSPLQHRTRFERQSRELFTYLIAWEAGTPVGHVGIDWPAERELIVEPEDRGHPTVHDLLVLPAHRGRGIGRALMLELERCVRERKMPILRLDTGLDDGYAAARKLYGSLGFAEVPGSLHIESSRFPGDRTSSFSLEILTIWEKQISRIGTAGQRHANDPASRNRGSVGRPTHRNS
jgi:GNAT superfamily N-acetyltransferase